MKGACHGAKLLPEFTCDNENSTAKYKKTDIEYVLENGQRIYTGGAIHFFLGKKDIPKEDHKHNRAHQLVGTTVLMDAKSGAVITVYGNRKGLPAIRKKSKYSIPTAY